MKAFLKYYIKDNLFLFKEKLKLLLFPTEVPILVFTMAKVGSLSVYFSLKNRLKRKGIFHIHSLEEIQVKESVKTCFENGIYPGSKSPVFLINNKIIKKEKRIKVISLFRDPLERNISAFFDAYELYVGNKPEDSTLNSDELYDIFQKKFLHYYPVEWYEKQFFEGLGIDVYKSSFNKELGFQVIKKENVEVLLISSHLPDDKKEQLIGEFCSLKSFKLQNRNITSNKVYGSIYKKFKEEIFFEKSYLDSLYKTKYARHFFTDLFIENQYKKWIK